MSVVEESGSSPLINDAKQPSHHERLKLQAERGNTERKRDAGTGSLVILEREKDGKAGISICFRKPQALFRRNSKRSSSSTSVSESSSTFSQNSARVVLGSVGELAETEGRRRSELRFFCKNDVLDGLKYASSHEWAKHEGSVVTIGIADHSQDHLGEVVFVELPEDGHSVSQRGSFGAVEGVKVTRDVNSPISGEVVEVNSKLTESPGLINSSPYEDGWMIKTKPRSPSELESLVDFFVYSTTHNHGS
ncbi:hypothetical protein ACFX11_020283 [Malus domestica]